LGGILLARQALALADSFMLRSIHFCFELAFALLKCLAVLQRALGLGFAVS